MSQDKPRRQPGKAGFRSGETVPVSGMWQPDHHDCPDVTDLWLRKQASFPPCPCCTLPASFFLVQEVPHISEDPDFE